ncbi:MAG: beta-eliminating lyase-related protein [Sphingomonadaceae bacterium]|nr:beta-eliminating lyase-related protein [Sphingomonadaceae bacterium]
MRFLSDNAAAACPEVLAAIVQANEAGAGYDGDRWSARLDDVVGSWLGREARVFAVGTGTAANALALATLCPPYGGVVCEAHAHVVDDECGAVEAMSGGARLCPVAGAHGKLSVPALERFVAVLRGDVHQTPPRALTLSQATESGTAYHPVEVDAIAAFARGRGWRVHMDGARIANACVHLGCAPGELVRGLDALSLGFIKNGGLGAEALVLFDMGLAEELAFRRKRAGQMPSKGRFRAAEILAMIETGAWRRNAAHANAGAARLAVAAGTRLLHPVEANELFVDLRGGAADALRGEGFSFYDWLQDGPGAARLVVAWDTPEPQISALEAALRRLPPL